MPNEIRMFIHRVVSIIQPYVQVVHSDLTLEIACHTHSFFLFVLPLQLVCVAVCTANLKFSSQ